MFNEITYNTPKAPASKSCEFIVMIIANFIVQQMGARQHLSNLWQCSKFNIITIITITTSEADVAAAVDAARRATLNAIKLQIFILCFRFRFSFLVEHFCPHSLTGCLRRCHVGRRMCLSPAPRQTTSTSAHTLTHTHSNTHTLTHSHAAQTVAVVGIFS